LLLLAPGAADRLARAVLLGAQILDTSGELAPALIQPEDLVDRAIEVATPQAAAERLGVLADRLDVQHV
jgi:hypothetical protein